MISVSSGSINKTLHVAMKFQRMTQMNLDAFKDEATMCCSVKYNFSNEMGSDANGIAVIYVLLSGKNLLTMLWKVLV